MCCNVPWLGLCAVLALCVLLGVQAGGPFDWQTYDAFDEINDRMEAVNRENCRSKPASELRLPSETLAQLPRFNKLLSTIIFPNRTNLLHLHNMALNRAFYYSYIFQKLNASLDFEKQPGLMYYMFSAAADISANEYNINGSAIFFDNNCSYANWYRNLAFNWTLPLFGPRAWRFDDHNDPTNWLREPTNRTIDIEDYGAGPQSNYSLRSYKINQWYDLFLPDDWSKKGLDSVRKHTYDVGIKYSNETGKFLDDEFQGKTFFGPPSPGQKETEHLPVVFTEPYFDCGRSNKWIVSAVSPVLDQLPRYLDWFHLRRHRFVAVSTMDMDFLSIDLNQCPLGIGNEPPNYFHNTARCKETTMCEPLYGWGFRRGGYQCVCKPGYRYPPWQFGPWQGGDIESATEEEYKNSFDCIPVELRQVIPVISGNGTRFQTSGGVTTLAGKKKRDVTHADKKARDQLNYDMYRRPEFARRTDRAAKAPTEPLRSRILNKKRRLLRLAGLQEIQGLAEGELGSTLKKRSIVPRYEYAPPKEMRLADEVTAEEEALKTKWAPRYKRDFSQQHNRHRRAAFDPKAHDRMMEIIRHKESINADNCHEFTAEELELEGDVSYGVDKIFSPQARTALRLSHFLSNFLQNVDKYEEYGNLRGDKLLNIEQLFGEVLANVMGDLKIKGSGVFFDIDKFEGPDGRTRQFFGPYAYRYEDEDAAPGGDVANTHFRAIDFAGFEYHYLDDEWFKVIKERWQSNTYGLTKFTEKPSIRSDIQGSSLRKFELYPLYYRAPKEEDGWWSAPYFDCDSYVNEWIITYSIPFFGLNSIGSAIEFKGAVIVDIKLDELDINQCPQPFYVPNAFKDTARCHYETTFCEPLPGKRFTRGGYKCECKQGYEYPFNDRAWYFDGQTMEEEWRKYVEGTSDRFNTLTCRISGAPTLLSSSWLTVLLLCAVCYLYQ